MDLSTNFTLEEMLKSETAERYGGDILRRQMNPPQEIIDNLTYLVQTVLQPLRDRCKARIAIRSGYRCAAVNTFVGSSVSSQHMQGEAADIVLLGKGNGLLWREALGLIDNIDQLIHEYGIPGSPAWVHVSTTRDKLRHEILLKDDRTYYQKLTIEEALGLA